MAATDTPQMDRLMETVVKMEASDLHLVVGERPTVRVHGNLKRLETVKLTAEALIACTKQIAPDSRQAQIQEGGGTDFAFGFKTPGGEVRFRVSVTLAHQESGGSAQTMVMRRLPNKFLTPEELGLPRQLVELMSLERGLVLVTGQTGSGKSTTLASLVNHVTETLGRSIITLEDPIEYVYKPGRCVVRQREVGTHVHSFQEGLRQALRMDPDIILVGEMRDLETTRAALSAAETGHLVLSTLHTNSARGTINRLVEQFDRLERSQIRAQVSEGLLAVLCQTLCPLASGEGRVAALEFMLNTPAIANLIREEKLEQVPGVMQTSAKVGMRLMDDHLVELVNQGRITRDVALVKGNDRRHLLEKLPR